MRAKANRVKSEKQQPFLIRDAKQVAALKAASRQELMDVLASMGTVSIPQLAVALGKPADSLYYHIRILQRVGLVQAEGSHESGGRTERLYRAVSSYLRLDYVPGKKGNAKGIAPIVDSMLRLTSRDFKQAFHEEKVVVDGPQRELWANRSTGWLTREQIAEINRHIAAMLRITVASPPKDEKRLFALTMVLTPLRRSLLIFAAALHLFALTNAYCQEKPTTLLRLNYLATGGDRWRRLAQVEMTGDLNLGGDAGTFHQVVDLKTGRDVTTFDAGSIHLQQTSLRDSNWQLDRSGVVTYADTPDARTDAINQSFVDRNGWFTAPANQLKSLGVRREGGETYQLVSVAPSGGRRMTLWLGAADHLLYRIDQLDASHQQSSIFFSNYRRVAGVLMPYSIRQSNGTASQDTIQTIRTVHISSTVNEAAFIAPASKFQDASLLEGRNSTSIPFVLADGRICVEVSVEGHAPIPFLLDSGGSNFITPEAARTLGIQGNGNVALSGTGEDQPNGQFATVKKLRLGSLELTNQQFLVASLPKFLQDRGSEPPIAGLIGAELLRRFPTTFDYQRQILTFFQPGSFSPRPSNAQDIKLLFNGGHPFLALLVDGVPGVFGIDTGDSSGITVFRPFYDAHRFPVEQPGQAKLQGGIGGQRSALLTRVNTVQLGRSVLKQPLITVNFAAKGMFSVNEIAGNLGYQFLRNFTFTLDYEHRVGYFAPSVDFGIVAEYNRSGLSLKRSEDGGVIAEHVNPNTPAARAGLQAGDRIVLINGKNTEGVASEVFVRMLSDAAGSPIVMVISHQGQQREVTFSLEELLPAGGRMEPLGGPPLSEAIPDDLNGVSPSRFLNTD
jgi:hypothetical protein